MVGCATTEVETRIETQALSTDTYPFVLRQTDVPGSTYFHVNFDHSSNGRDFGAQRFTGSGWSSIKIDFADYALDPKNSDSAIYNIPVYSPVDGEIVSCWRNAPENIKPSVYGDDDESHPGRLSDPVTIVGSGNHVNIQTDDGRIVLLAHFRPGTVPEHLCPFDDVFVVDGNNKLPNSEFPVEATIPKAQRPRVQQGEMVGRVGNSGSSSGPHVHWHVKPVTGGTAEWPEVGTSLPIYIHGVYTKPKTSENLVADWTPVLDGEVEVGELVHGSPFLRAAGRVEDTISETVALEVDNKAVTVVAAAGGIQINTYDYAAGAITPLSTRTIEGGSQLAAAEIGVSGDFVIAFRDTNGNLKLVGWTVSPGGILTRKGEASAGSVSKVAIAAAPTGLGVVTAVRDSGGILKVISWTVSNPLSSITRISSASGGPVTQLSITSTSLPFRGVTIASRDLDGNLEVRTFSTTLGLVLAARDTEIAGPASNMQVGTVRVDAFTEHVITAMRDSEGDLRLIDWSMSSTGTLTRHETEVADGIIDVRLARGRQQDILTIARDANSNARVATWRVWPSGRIERHGEAAAGWVGAVSLTAPFSGDDGDVVLGSVMNGSYDKELIAWKYSN
jgi:hypothetical protein